MKTSYIQYSTITCRQSIKLVMLFITSSYLVIIILYYIIIYYIYLKIDHFLVVISIPFFETLGQLPPLLQYKK